MEDPGVCLLGMSLRKLEECGCVHGVDGLKESGRPEGRVVVGGELSTVRLRGGATGLEGRIRVRAR